LHTHCPNSINHLLDVRDLPTLILHIFIKSS
jgi:hypothetical protein